MRKILYTCLLLVVASCVSKTKYEDLKDDYQKSQLEKENLEVELADLQEQYYEVKSDHDRLVIAKRREEAQKNRKKYVSESEALGYIKDYYSFYNSDIKYRNIQLRRTDKNRFKVSLEEVTNKGTFSNDDFFWNSSVYNLTVNNDNTYKYERSF